MRGRPTPIRIELSEQERSALEETCRFSPNSTGDFSQMFVMGETRVPGLGRRVVFSRGRCRKQGPDAEGIRCRGFGLREQGRRFSWGLSDVRSRVTIPGLQLERTRKRQETPPSSCPWCERDSFFSAQRLPERFALGRAELGLDERYGPVIVIDDEPGGVLVAVDPQLPHVALRELDGPDTRFHDARLSGRPSVHSS